MANANLLSSETPVRLVPESGNVKENNAGTKLTCYENRGIIFVVSSKVNADIAGVLTKCTQKNRAF